MSRRIKVDRKLRREKSKCKRADGSSAACRDSVADDATSRPRAKITLRKKLVFTLIVQLLLLGGAELTCRVLGLWELQETAHYIADWSEEWGSDFYVLSSTTGEHRADINRDGMRDRDHRIENTTGATRIVCLGDSVTFGYLYSASESYPAILQRMLDEQNRNCEVFNMALPGWSTRQQRYAYERIARKYRPEHVVLGVCLNDIPELRNNLIRPPAWIAVPYKHSALVRALMRPQAGEIHEVEELFSYSDEAPIRDGWDRFFEEVRLLNEHVTRDGASLTVLLFPFRFQVIPEAPEAIPQRTMAAFVGREGIQYIDLLPTLQRTGWDAFVDYDHLTPEGATSVAKCILESELLESSATDTEKQLTDSPR